MSESNSKAMLSYSAVAAISVASYVALKELWNLCQPAAYAPRTTSAGDEPVLLPTPEEASLLISSRRTVSPMYYDPTRKVPREVIDSMLEAANWAPTHGKTEPWRFIVYTGAAIDRLAQVDGEIYKESTTPKTFIQRKMDKKTVGKKNSSYVIAICMKRQKSGKVPHIEEVEAVACAVQNMHLLATAHGVGCFWGSGPNIESKKMREFLGISGDDLCLGLFHVGYSTKSHPKGHRGNISDKVKWVEE